LGVGVQKKSFTDSGAQSIQVGGHQFMWLQHQQTEAAFPPLLEGEDNGGRTACREKFSSGLHFSVT